MYYQATAVASLNAFDEGGWQQHMASLVSCSFPMYERKFPMLLTCRPYGALQQAAKLTRRR
jgi:hypothetical protein